MLDINQTRARLKTGDLVSLHTVAQTMSFSNTLHGIRVAQSGIYVFSICICRGHGLTERRECVRKVEKEGRRESETKCTQFILYKQGNMKSTDTVQATV